MSVQDSSHGFSRSEIAETLSRTGFTVESVRDALDRLGLEFVFIAQQCYQQGAAPPLVLAK